MTASLGLVIVVILVSLALSFFFSGAETMVISVNQFNLRHRRDEGDVEAGKTLRFLSNAPILLSAVLIGVNLGETFVALFFKLLLDNVWATSHYPAFYGIAWDEFISLLVLTPIIVVFAEVLPKALFRANADVWIHRVRPVLAFFMYLFYPVTKAMDLLVSVFMLPFGGRHQGQRLTRSDIIMMLAPPAAGPAEGAPVAEEETPAEVTPQEKRERTPPVIATLAAIHEPDERRLIQNIIELEQTQIREIMQPLVELEAVHLGRITVEGFLEQARNSGYTRFPAYRKRIIYLVGYIDVYDVLRNGKGAKSLDEFVRPALYIPETKRVDDLLHEFLTSRMKTAIAVDEYGGCSGWVTREDILEEIVGELDDELDERRLRIKEQEDGSYIIEGRTHTADVDDVLGTTLEADVDCDTLGGIIMKHIGRIPRAGDTVTVAGWRFEILDMDGMRIGQVQVARPSGAA